MSSRHRENPFPLFLFLIAVAGMLFFADGNRWLDPVRRPLEQAILRARVSHEETKDETIARLTAAVTSLKKVEDDLTIENELLRIQLQAPLPPKFDFTPAYVIDVTKGEKEAVMRIAAGGDQGVAEGMAVVTETTLMGTVAQVTPRIATVRLLADADSAVAVTTEAGATGLVVGGFEDSVTKAYLTHVLQTDELQDGEKVETNGDGEIPPNLLVGTVAAVVSEAREPFQRAEINLSADPKKLRQVFVITKW